QMKDSSLTGCSGLTAGPSAGAAQCAGPRSRPETVPDGWPALVVYRSPLFLASLGPPRGRRNAPGRGRGLGTVLPG
ncbi:MAG: hypothetical protein AAF732_16610, partial [Pseudomonadota bacterium]